MKDKFIIFDVGAHWGQDSLDLVRNNPNHICWAFEPTPRLANRLESLSDSFADRYHVWPVAISDYNGTSDFHLVAGDTGSSSLNKFAANINNTWPGRDDFRVVDTIKVQVWRLDTWIDEWCPGLERIDHLHIDAQGSDLQVLIGLGDKIDLVETGVIEVPQRPEISLYEGQHTKESAIAWLVKNGFEIYDQTHQVNEDNLYFRKVK